MKYLELLTATVRNEPCENIAYCRYICYPVGLQATYHLSDSYTSFHIYDQRLADEFRDRSGVVEMFQGYRTLDADNFDFKLMALTREDWEFFLDITYLPVLKKYIPINQILAEAEGLFDLYWYHPGSCYFPGPAQENLWTKCGVEADCGDPQTLVRVGRHSA